MSEALSSPTPLPYHQRVSSLPHSPSYVVDLESRSLSDDCWLASDVSIGVYLQLSLMHAVALLL